MTCSVLKMSFCILIMLNKEKETLGTARRVSFVREKMTPVMQIILCCNYICKICIFIVCIKYYNKTSAQLNLNFISLKTKKKVKYT